VSGDPRLSRSIALVIGPQRGAIEGARRAAASLGYHVHVVEEPVVGEARDAARRHVEYVAAVAADAAAALCHRLRRDHRVGALGPGRGGRNQEFACAMAAHLPRLGVAVGASIGTDGIDGPTDAAGAIVDTTTLARARAAGVGHPDTYLAANDSYAFFDPLGDLLRPGPTGTNVGDVQILLIA
jgi:glycerate 2-kinase